MVFQFLNMLQVVKLVLILILATRVWSDDTYTTKYDGVNLEEILSSERLLTGYVKCLQNQGPCTPDGKELKKNLPDAIEHDCSKCTPRQKEGADQVMEYIIDHRPDDWVKLEQIYQQDGSYKKKYLERKAKAEKENTEAQERIVTPDGQD